MKVPKWYDSGVRFSCQGCGQCCRSLDGEEACVYLDGDDIRGMAAHLRIAEREFKALYTTQRHDLVVIRDPEKDCVFLRDGKCLVYPVRPAQCRTWPFWKIALVKKNWDEKVVPGCRGVGKGRRYSRKEIEHLSEDVSPL
jgi:Fe-S-cluster containining protein